MYKLMQKLRSDENKNKTHHLFDIITKKRTTDKRH